MSHVLNYAIALLIGAVLTASGLPMDSAPVKADMPEGVQRSKRLSSDDGAQALIAGLTYTRGILVSCVSPTILPEVSGISKVDCTGVVSSVYKSLIAALDKVLRLYDLQEKFLDSDTSNSSVEMRALQIVIDTLVNQTCNWIESLGLRYAGSNASLTCTSEPAQMRKLHALISTYQLMEEARDSATSYVDTHITMTHREWLRTSGAQPDLNTLLNGTVYQDSLLLRNRCRPLPHCSQ